jgi:hypothetical protein
MAQSLADILPSLYHFVLVILESHGAPIWVLLEKDPGVLFQCVFAVELV